MTTGNVAVMRHDKDGLGKSNAVQSVGGWTNRTGYLVEKCEVFCYTTGHLNW